MPATVASAMQAGRDTSSSHGKVFAKASKEWTIPPRPRPGRKAAEPAAAAPKAAKGAQNRDAQRAFRERKQDYVAELEAKIKEYENQEIQKAITLQNVSIALKSENTSLRSENDRLRELVRSLGGDPTVSPDGNASDASGSTTTSRKGRKKRPREPVVDEGASAARPMSKGGSRHGSAEPGRRPSLATMPPNASPIPSAPSPSTVLKGSLGSSPSSPGYRSIQDLLNMPGPSSAAAAGPPMTLPPNSIGSPSVSLNGLASGPLSPPVWTPYQTPYQIQPPPFAYHRASPSILSGPGFDVGSLPSTSGVKASSTRTTAENVDVDCGFCTDDATCVCRMIKEDANLGGGNSGAVDVKPKIANGNSSGIDRPQAATVADGASSSVSLLRRRPKNASSQPLWAVAPAPALPECTGDPSNCPACADDPFGKAFCEELGTEPPASAEVAAHQEQLVKREQEAHHVPSSLAHSAHAHGEDVTMTVSCCGAPDACGSHAQACSTDGGEKHLTLGVEQPQTQHVHHDSKMIPVADAWRQFKSHPNASFADLSLLAEVVSGRAPVPSFASAPSSPLASPSSPSSMHPTSSHPEPPSAPPAKRRRLELDAAHVQEALRMLDARSASGGGNGGEGVLQTAVRRNHLTRRLSDLRGTLEGMEAAPTGAGDAAQSASVLGIGI